MRHADAKLALSKVVGLPTMVASIHVISPSRVVVGDLAESFHYIKYQRQENTFVLFADDVVPRWLTASCVLDANTLAGTDKFGNLFVTRLPQEVSDDVDDAQILSATGARQRHRRTPRRESPS